MQVDEFAKTNKPAKPQSRLMPYLSDLKKLRAANYTIEQLQVFLKLNGVVISTGGIAKFLRQHSIATNQQAALENRHGAKVDEVEPESETSVTSSSNPADLDKIFNTKVDIDDLIKQAKAKRKAK